MSLHSQSHTCIHHYVPECATKMIRLSMWQCSGIGCPPFPHHIPATIPLLQPELDGRDACIGIEGGGSYVTEEGGGVKVCWGKLFRDEGVPHNKLIQIIE